MTNFIPIFPLGIVVYPGEKLHLHIFEERYKQLIRECFGKYGKPPKTQLGLYKIGKMLQSKQIK